MQAIYFPKNLLEFKKDDKFLIQCVHDEYSLWFDLFPISSKESLSKLKSNYDDVSLGVTIVSRNRLAQLNDTSRNDMFIRLLKKVSQITNRLYILISFNSIYLCLV